MIRLFSFIAAESWIDMHNKIRQINNLIRYAEPNIQAITGDSKVNIRSGSGSMHEG